MARRRTDDVIEDVNPSGNAGELDQIAAAFEAAATEASPGPTFDRLMAMAHEAVELESVVDQLSADLAAANGALNDLKAKKIPDLMKEVGVESLQCGGRVLEVTTFVSGSLPKEEDRRAKAIAWLEANGGGGLVKTSMSIDYGKADREEAIRVYRLLKAQDVPVKAETGVHSATLQAFAKERLRKGEPIDTEALGLYTGAVVKIKAGKK